MFDPLTYLIVFAVGGAICMIGQILIITTQMTSARILVTFLLTGALLETIGVYQYMHQFAGSGVSVPIIGFGASLARGAIDASQSMGLLGIFTGGLTSTAGGLAIAIFAGFFVALIFNSKTK